jgi:GTP-sensing pleiotropic transcriptional regulator CodY
MRILWDEMWHNSMTLAGLHGVISQKTQLFNYFVTRYMPEDRNLQLFHYSSYPRKQISSIISLLVISQKTQLFNYFITRYIPEDITLQLFHYSLYPKDTTLQLFHYSLYSRRHNSSIISLLVIFQKTQPFNYYITRYIPGDITLQLFHYSLYSRRHNPSINLLLSGMSERHFYNHYKR